MWNLRFIAAYQSNNKSKVKLNFFNIDLLYRLRTQLRLESPEEFSEEPPEQFSQRHFARMFSNTRKIEKGVFRPKNLRKRREKLFYGAFNENRGLRLLILSRTSSYRAKYSFARLRNPKQNQQLQILSQLFFSIFKVKM